MDTALAKRVLAIVALILAVLAFAFTDQRFNDAAVVALAIAILL